MFYAKLLTDKHRITSKT